MSLLSSISLEFPLVASTWVSETELVVAGGGGKSKTGVPNSVVLLRSSPNDPLSVVYKMNFDDMISCLTSDPSRRLVSFCTPSECRIFQLARASPYFRQSVLARLPTDEGDQSGIAISATSGALVGFESGSLFHLNVAGAWMKVGTIEKCNFMNILLSDSDLCISADDSVYIGTFTGILVNLTQFKFPGKIFKKGQYLSSNLIVFPDLKNSQLVLAEKTSNSWSFREISSSIPGPVTCLALSPYIFDPSSQSMTYSGLIGTGEGVVRGCHVNTAWKRAKLGVKSKKLHYSVTSLSLSDSDSVKIASVGLEGDVGVWAPSAKSSCLYLITVVVSLFVVIASTAFVLKISK
ncbi:hypothetical protein RCL1_006544 [Eukaryota sp. TZLM3-RCL]